MGIPEGDAANEPPILAQSEVPPEKDVKLPQLGRVNTGRAPPEIPEDPKVLQGIAGSYKRKLLAWDPVRQ